MTAGSNLPSQPQLSQSLRIEIDLPKGIMTYVVNLPNVGAFIDIENNKILFSQGRYSLMTKNNTFTNNLALDMIDTIATFTVIMPKEFHEGLAVSSLFDLDLKSIKSLVKAYKEQFHPWVS